MKDSMSKYIVFDPWHVRLGDWMARHVICPIRGHKWSPKMHDMVCRRCSISTPRTDLGGPMCAQFVDYVRRDLP